MKGLDILYVVQVQMNQFSGLRAMFVPACLLPAQLLNPSCNGVGKGFSQPYNFLPPPLLLIDSMNSFIK